jgi:hypothetical protein
VEQLRHEVLGDDLISVPRLSRIHYNGKFFDYPLKALSALRCAAVAPRGAAAAGLRFPE